MHPGRLVAMWLEEGSPSMRARKMVWLGVLAAGVLGSGSALAVSDGGYIQANVSPTAFRQWVSEALSANRSYVLTHPLPGADAGFGACADGLCFSVQTQRRVAYQGSGTGQHDAANYQGKKWDPRS